MSLLLAIFSLGNGGRKSYCGQIDCWAYSTGILIETSFT